MLSLLYGPVLTYVHDTGKTIALTIWTFVGKVMFLLFNTLSRFVIAFLPRSKHLLISWLQSPSTVILEPKKIKSVTVSTFSPSICHDVMGREAMILVLEAGKLQILFMVRSFSLARSYHLPSHCTLTWWREAALVSLPFPIRALIPMGTPSSWLHRNLITSQRAQYQIPHRIQHINCWRETNILSITAPKTKRFN